MANASYLKTQLAAFPPAEKAALSTILDYLLDNIRLGRCEAGHRATNLQLYAVEGTTHATPDTEFSIAHGLGVAPYLLMQVLPLDTVNAEIVPLAVTRAADSERIYLSSSVASAAIRLLVEA